MAGTRFRMNDYGWIYIGENNAVPFNTENPPFHGYASNNLAKFAYYRGSNIATNYIVFACNISGNSIYAATTGGYSRHYTNVIHSATNLYISSWGLSCGSFSYALPDMVIHDSGNIAVASMDDGNWTGPVTYYPIHYFHSDGCTITGPVDAAPGQDCVVIVNPASGYVFRGSSGVVIQDSTGANVPFIVSGNRISFTYPQPI